MAQSLGEVRLWHMMKQLSNIVKPHCKLNGSGIEPGIHRLVAQQWARTLPLSKPALLSGLLQQKSNIITYCISAITNQLTLKIQ